ncbi:hypothetical protein FNV43_RR13875 [Rhamnella rubrinervis]|uniref:Uncharacterized protein n=1 Tax=Rhamnella rubrinervis TaxID=2594499 RepID=A0A8K0MFR4_9ROSA|nr:hypothetical protein FNV43_RR13875 [Rhamnella rubrinervis]
MAAPVLSVTVTPTKCVTSLPPAPPFFSSTRNSSRCLSLSSSVRFKRFLAPVIDKAAERGVAEQPPKHICRAAATEYKFPDPIPEFADAETEKFRTYLLTKLSKKDIYGDSAEQVVGICTEIFSTFLHTEYGGPGTLLVVPFIEMADTLHERGLPGASQAARAAVKWAQDHVDKDWSEWTGDDDS